MQPFSMALEFNVAYEISKMCLAPIYNNKAQYVIKLRIKLKTHLNRLSRIHNVSSQEILNVHINALTYEHGLRPIYFIC